MPLQINIFVTIAQVLDDFFAKALVFALTTVSASEDFFDSVSDMLPRQNIHFGDEIKMPKIIDKNRFLDSLSLQTLKAHAHNSTFQYAHDSCHLQTPF